jgi:hypothetical protein
MREGTAQIARIAKKNRMYALLFAVLSVVRAVSSHVDLSSFVSATHWSPCYFLNSSLPSLHDGAAALASSGSRAIKVILAPNPEDTYPWNTDWDSIMRNVTDLGSLAATPIWDAVFRGTSAGGAFGSGWDYSTFSVITYRLSSSSWNYWCDSFTDADTQAETAEFSSLTAHLLTKFAGSGKVWYLDHWEGDWSAHCGNYDPNKPPTAEVQARMVQWLAARQAGVDAGRAAWCRAHLPACSDGRSDGLAIHAAAGASVYCASEVNLVGTSITRGMRNNVLGVLPYVALDVVSYSSYDTMWNNGGATGFGAALDFITAHHNRTAASPSPALFVAEYGVAQVEDTDPAHVAALVRNVNAWALSIGPSGVARAAATFYWELFDNEVDTTAQFPGGRCNNQTGPQFNASALHGFWMLRPDGSQSPSWHAIAALANGSAPAPTPEKATCVFTPDTDWQGPDGGDAVKVSAQSDCCDACAANVLCVAAVWQPQSGTCYRKFGQGTRKQAPGVTLCELQPDVRGPSAKSPPPRLPPPHAFPRIR